MAARTYATATEYEAWTGKPGPANVDALLRAASVVVDVLLVARAYDTDELGYPTDTDHRQSLSDATCAVAAEAVEAGVWQVGGSQQWESVGIGSVKLSGRRAADGAGHVAGFPVPAQAHVLLSDVGTVRVWSR